MTYPKHIKLLALLGGVLSSWTSVQAFESLSRTTTIDQFSGTITASTKALDRYTGTLYVATDGTGNLAATGPDGTFALASLGRTDTVFTALATDDLVSHTAFKTISLLPTEGKEATHIACVTETTSGQVITVNVSDKSVEQSGNLTDDTVAPAARISKMTTGTTEIFARVVQAAGVEGDDGSGIAHVHINADNTLVRLRGNDTTGARTLDITGPNSVTRIAANLASMTVNDMHWDSELQRLYIAITGVSGGTAGNGVKGVAVGAIDENTGVLGALTAITPDASTGNGNNGGIFMVKTGGGAQRIAINKVRTMKTSTGHHYLVVNGGTSSITTTGNLVFAHPLQPLGSANGGGTLAANTITGSIFASAVAANGLDDANTFSFTNVGGGPAPWDGVITCSDMVVVGDSVYVSAAAQRNTVVNPGVFVSHALFDREGKITSWTPWERAFPSEVSTSQAAPASDVDSTALFDVDAQTGKLIRGQHFDGTQTTSLTRTRWKLVNNTDNTLQKQINSNLSDGCFCMLDLPEGTPGIGTGANVQNSFVLFGGFEKVIFARTRSSNNNTITAQEGYTAGVNFRLTDNTDGLFGAGPIRCLGYTYRGDEATQNYFLAGTNKGLYAYTESSGAGFATLTTLAATPFDTGKWQRVAENLFTTTVAISNIVTGSGDRVYVLTKDTTTIGGVTDKLYELPTDGTIPALRPRLIAQSGQGGLPTNAVLSGCAIITTTNSGAISTGNVDAGTFGVLSTNNGIYTSTCDLRDLGQRVGEWELVLSTSDIPFFGLHMLKDARKRETTYAAEFAPFRNTHVWGTSITDDQRGLGIFESSRFIQAGLNDAAQRTTAKMGELAAGKSVQPQPNADEPVAKDRRFFLSNDSANVKHVELTTRFYSDGARRFFVRTNPNEDVPSQLRVFPFNSTEWNQTVPFADPDISTATVKRIHWVETLSGNGQLMAGTDTGVIVLE